MKHSRAFLLWTAAAAAVGTLPALADRGVSLYAQQTVVVQQNISVNVPTGHSGGQKILEGTVDTGTKMAYIKAMGLPKRGTTGPKAMLTAQDAAETVAMGNLAQMMVGAYVAGASMVEDRESVFSRVCQTFGGLVKKGQIYDDPENELMQKMGYAKHLGWHQVGNSGYYGVVMEVPLNGPRSIAEAWCNPDTQRLLAELMRRPPLPAEAPAPELQETAATSPVTYSNVEPTKDVPAPAAGAYTGVIIQCEEAGVEVGMAPKIVSASGKVVFGENVPIEVAVNDGAVGYARSLADAEKLTARLGARPMPAIKATGKAGSWAAVVSDADAEKILAENGKGHFLDRCGVVFVIKGR